MASSKPRVPLNKQIDFVKEYSRVYNHYERYAQILQEILKKAASLYAPLSVVQSRAKTVSSFMEKIIRKDKYQNPLLEVTDLCGARVITHFQSQVKIISELIKNHFIIDEANSIDVSSRLKDTEFGYLSVHYIVTPRSKEILGVTIPDSIKELKAEVQIRTFLQHAWADILHDRLYKATINVPKKWQRESARIAAVLEKADEAFALMSETIDAFSSDYRVLLCEDKLDKEIKVLEAILAAEPDETKKVFHALRLANALDVKGEWLQVIDVLMPFSHDHSSDEVLMEMGRAICLVTDPEKDPQRYEEGQNFLRTVAQADLPLSVAGKYAGIKTEAARQQALRARAFYLLGKSWEKMADKMQNSRECFYKAYRLMPKNPYYFMTFIEYEICLHDDYGFLDTLRPALAEVIETCRSHAEMDLELPQAFLTMAKAHALMQEHSEALHGYARVADLVSCEKSTISQNMLRAELAALQRIEKLCSGHADLYKTVIHQILWLKYQDRDSRLFLESRRLCEKDFDQPVCIIVGGAAGMDKMLLNRYYNYLAAALDNYAGTVISGGTTSGIPGEVGAVAHRMARHNEKQFRLIGYIPQVIPEDVTIDDHYDELYRTEGTTFSEREALMYWTDIILSGIEPREVLVVGINGGRISDTEYRLALGLGAKVGLVQNSGRAASALMADADWKMHPRIIVLPEEDVIAWSFVHQNRPSSLSKEEIERVAPEVHEFYLKKKFASGATSDESMKPWANLAESLKNSNRQQIAFIESVLNKVELGVRKFAGRPQLFDFEQEYHDGRTYLDVMAELEHARFVVERLSEGWAYGAVKDIEKKVSPYLLSWVRIPDDIKEYDLEAVRHFQELMNQLGFEIYKK